MTIVIMHQTISKYDAIGNDISYFYQLLSKKFQVFVYCEFLFNNIFNIIDDIKLSNLIKEKNNLIIYHHSIFWEKGEEILNKAKCEVIIRYHNITPPEYFIKYSKNAALKCEKGREQTIRFLDNFSHFFWMSASNFNLKELNINISERFFVIPPFNNISYWKDIYPEENNLTRLMEDDFINLLFVGRIAPNKNYIFLLEILYFFKKYYNNRIRLNIIGSCSDDLHIYKDELFTFIKKNRLQNNFNYLGKVEENILLSYFLGCDFFICVSNHEGFCVPLIEAQSLYLPVIAKDTTAITETLGENQLLLLDKVEEYAAAIKILYENSEYRDFLIQNGIKNYLERFSNEAIEKKFSEVFELITGYHL